MSFEIRLTIPEDSQSGHLIASLSAEQHISPSEVVERIVSQVAHEGPTEPREPFRRETPAELSARIQAKVKARPARPPVNTSGSEAILGMLAGDEPFSRAMDEIISGRPLRYGFGQ